MTNRELVLACLNHEEGPVPQWLMGFFNKALAERLMPGLVYPTFYHLPAEGAYGFDALDDEDRGRSLAANAFIDKCSIGVGRGANWCFGHAGPGEFNSTVIERGENHFVVEYETGARHYYQLQPHNYHIVRSPVSDASQADALALPDPHDPRRWAGFAQDVAWFRERGEFTHGHINGFFSGLHYFLMDYPDALMGFRLDPEGMRRLVARLGEWNLAAAQHMLDAGVDCITLCDDLGSGKGLLISPEIYREFIKPWHARLNELVHSYRGRFSHLHSHGCILKIFQDIVETGFDMINPLDADEKMNLAELKERYGARVTLVGGMNKYFFDWDCATQEAYLRQAIAIGRKGGGYILMDTGGIPENVQPDRFRQFLEMSRHLRTRVP
jgi:uroporphyrinogen decarboxylase